MLSFNSVLTVTFTLFAVIDVVGGIPAIISIKQHQKNFSPAIATLVAGALMVFFLFTGETFLRLVGVDVRSFALAGSIVIFILAMEMILGVNLFKTNPDDAHSGNFVPVAFPLIAGAGTLTTIISLRSIYTPLEILIGIALNLVIIFLVLLSMDWIEDRLGKTGLAAVKKFFGVILLAIAIKIFSTYVKF
ncbi:MAG: multiple antibiotic resistance (MarC)-related protein [Bacteroidota bacterium]|nr:multiple antibiotic resistance (MarC)-related protein [Bacteroidota bacterium]